MFWRSQMRLHDKEWAIIAPNGDTRIVWARRPFRGTRGPRCDRCGASLLQPNGIVIAQFAFDRPLVGYVDCTTCLTRNTRRLIGPRPDLYG